MKFFFSHFRSRSDQGQRTMRGASMYALALLSGAFLLGAALVPGASAAGYLKTDGNRIVDAATGQPVKLNGINWFGFETANYCPHGLWQRDLDAFLDQMEALGYNFLRVPYCNQMFDPGVMPNGINTWENPDLAGLTPIQLLDELIERAGARGMRIMLDRHRPGSDSQSELWYTAQYSEQRWIDDWKMLAQRYATNPTVVAADLHNEPRGPATWGSGDPATDWRLAAERCGNAILSVNTNWLIVVEGIENYQGTYYWWGGNLMGAGQHPVRLQVTNRLIYSPHDYGPGVFNQSWFNDPSFPANLPAIWDARWAYIHRQGIAPILVGEFGGRNVDLVSSEGIWQNALVDYIATNGIYWTYWCWNPNSGDTGGVLNDDWRTIHQAKQDMLNRLIQAEPPPPPPRPAAFLIQDHFPYGSTQTSLSGLGSSGRNWEAGWIGQTNAVFFPGLSLNRDEPGYINNGEEDGMIGYGSGDAGNATARLFAAPLTGTVWISALVRFDTAGDDVLFWLRDNKSPVMNNNFVALRGSKDTSNVDTLMVPHPCIRYNGVNDASVASEFALNQTHLFLVRVVIDSEGANDTIEFWVNPDLTRGESGLGAPIYSKSGQDAFGTGISGVRVSFGGSGSRMDALRISKEAAGFRNVLGGTLPPRLSPHYMNGEFQISFQTEPGRTYTCESTATLEGTWTEIDTAVGTGDTITITHSPGSQMGFYRLRLD